MEQKEKQEIREWIERLGSLRVSTIEWVLYGIRIIKVENKKILVRRGMEKLEAALDIDLTCEILTEEFKSNYLYTGVYKGITIRCFSKEELCIRV